MYDNVSELRCKSCVRSGLTDLDFRWSDRKGTRTRDPHCLECRRAKERVYYTKRREDIQKRAYARLSDEQRQRARQRTKKWAAANPTRVAASAFAGGIRRRYGISLARYLCALQQQNYKCLRCKRPDWGTRIQKPAIDHCHATGKFRGLLCIWCNQMLGHLGDDLLGLEDSYRTYKAYLEGRL